MAMYGANQRKKDRHGQKIRIYRLYIRIFCQAGDFEYLLFLGDSAFVERNQETIQRLVNVLNKSGVRFAYLGNEEKSSGNEILRMGEIGLFEMLAEHNIGLFKKYGVKKIIALSPHSFHALKNEYPKIDPDLKVEVIHYTKLICDLLKDGKISYSKEFNVKAAYHDSCYLGKHNSIYEEPREILRAIPGLEVVEMDYIMEKGVCCGGGGGGQWIERGDGVVVENVRFKQAVDMDLDVLATACPVCAQQFEAAREHFPESHLVVKDVIELVYDAL
jgi:Fe-S oxidoreductase